MRLRIILFLGVLNFCLVTRVFANSTGSSLPSASSLGFVNLLTIILCVKLRREEIGGWLLYFYIKLYLDAIFTLLELIFNYNQYLPIAWSVLPSLYLWYLVSVIPAKIVTFLVLGFGEKLRFSRNGKWLKWLRGVVWIELVVLGLESTIDLKFFRSNLPSDFFSLLWPFIFLPYLYFSRRINRVFGLKDWPNSETMPPQTNNGKEVEIIQSNGKVD